MPLKPRVPCQGNTAITAAVEYQIPQQTKYPAIIQLGITANRYWCVVLGKYSGHSWNPGTFTVATVGIPWVDYSVMTMYTCACTHIHTHTHTHAHIRSNVLYKYTSFYEVYTICDWSSPLKNVKSAFQSVTSCWLYQRFMLQTTPLSWTLKKIARAYTTSYQHMYFPQEYSYPTL